MLIAITRAVSRAMERCELTHIPRQAIDLEAARRQHDDYERQLQALGCRLVRLPEEPDLPDSVFVEDMAIVLDELAVVTRPGALSRRPESAAVTAALRDYRALVFLAAPATLDGGDVLRVGRHLFVGLTGRSNAAAVEQLQGHLAVHGYTVSGVPVRSCLHLKSAACEIAPGRLLVNPDWVSVADFPGLETLAVDPAEPHAANALRIDDQLVYPSAFPATRRRLEALGLHVRTVDLSELAKAEGAVTCCSLIFRAAAR